MPIRSVDQRIRPAKSMPCWRVYDAEGNREPSTVSHVSMRADRRSGYARPYSRSQTRSRRSDAHVGSDRREGPLCKGCHSLGNHPVGTAILAVRRLWVRLAGSESRRPGGQANQLRKVHFLVLLGHDQTRHCLFHLLVEHGMDLQLAFEDFRVIGKFAKPPVVILKLAERSSEIRRADRQHL